MLVKLIPKPKISIFSLFFQFSTFKDEEKAQIRKFRNDLMGRNDLKSAIEGNGTFYVNKMDGLCELMTSSRSSSIFRPRRMGKSTMIEDLKFLCKNGTPFFIVANNNNNNNIFYKVRRK